MQISTSTSLSFQVFFLFCSPNRKVICHQMSLRVLFPTWNFIGEERNSCCRTLEKGATKKVVENDRERTWKYVVARRWTRRGFSQGYFNKMAGAIMDLLDPIIMIIGCNTRPCVIYNGDHKPYFVCFRFKIRLTVGYRVLVDTKLLETLVTLNTSFVFGTCDVCFF